LNSGRLITGSDVFQESDDFRDRDAGFLGWLAECSVVLSKSVCRLMATFALGGQAIIEINSLYGYVRSLAI